MNHIENMVLLDYLFDAYDLNKETHAYNRSRKAGIKKRIGIEYNIYYQLKTICEQNNISMLELLEYIYLYYLNIYQSNNKKRAMNNDQIYYNKYRKARQYKIRINPICERCEKLGVIVPVHEIHHVVPIMTGKDHNNRMQLATDITNMESLCLQCHLKQHGVVSSIPEMFW
jgi:5-methylcytosine-specific restriction endonuclease McrA